jgi:hypothetical protein
LDGQSVYVYDANPGLVIPHLNWDKFQRNVALLTQAFVDRKQGTLKAWQIHFSLPVLEKIEKGKEVKSITETSIINSIFTNILSGFVVSSIGSGQ